MARSDRPGRHTTVGLALKSSVIFPADLPLKSRIASTRVVPQVRQQASEETVPGVHLVIGVVEDSDDLRESLVELLATCGHRAVGFSCAEELLELNHGLTFELMVLDLNLPGEDGLSLARRLKRIQPRLRVIMMTTRTLLPDRVLGYESGADLYLPKPVAEDEFVAAVAALARQLAAEAGTRLTDLDVPVRLGVRALELQGPSAKVTVNLREMALLAAFAAAPGQRLEHWQLLEMLGMVADGSAKSSLAVTITRLRAKLVQIGCGSGSLKALRSEGYQLCLPLQID